MGQPQEPHHRLPFGNPFKKTSSKGSQLSQRPLFLLNAFEFALTARLRKLNPKDKHDVLSLAWMVLAMESLCETHTDIKTLITELDLPVTGWDEKWIDVYMDISVKLLDICNALSSELLRLNQGHLLLQCALHNLESNTSEKLVRACSSLDSWRQNIGTKNPRLENCKSILEGLVDSVSLPKVKSSAKGKVLMQAMYGAKIQTVFVCSVAAAVFSVVCDRTLVRNWSHGGCKEWYSIYVSLNESALWLGLNRKFLHESAINNPGMLSRSKEKVPFIPLIGQQHLPCKEESRNCSLFLLKYPMRPQLFYSTRWTICMGFVLQGRTELSPHSNYCDSGNTRWPCSPGKSYKGRGPIQLSW